MHLNKVLQLFYDPLSLLAYPMITHTPPVAGNLHIRTIVARQWPTIIAMHKIIVNTFNFIQVQA